PAPSMRFNERSLRSSGITARMDSGSTSPGRGRPIISQPSPIVATDECLDTQQLVLGDLFNHVLAEGVVISGNVTIAIADLDLLVLDLRLLLTSIESSMRHTIDRSMRELTSGVVQTGGADAT